MSDMERWEREWRPGVVFKAQGSDWRVATGRNFRVDTTGDWDGGAAQEQIFKWAGWPDKPNSSKARRCFLMYDANEPDLKGSYKYPICIIVDGQPVVSREGLGAAAGYLPQGKGFSDDVQKKARAVLDDYYKKADKEKEG